MFFRVAWLVVLVWLGLCVFAQAYFAWSWLAESAQPQRQAHLSGLAGAAMDALPAVAGIALLRWRGWSEAATNARRVAMALAASWAVLLLLSLVAR